MEDVQVTVDRLSQIHAHMGAFIPSQNHANPNKLPMKIRKRTRALLQGRSK